MGGSIADLKSIFGNALEIRSPAQRQAYLERACAGNAGLRAEVEALLEASAGAPHFLEPLAGSPVVTVDEPPVLERPGTVIGSYKLLEQIGEGGFGVVFMAEQQEPVRRKVALKILKPGMDTRQVVARFEAERQALALMDHPNIAKVLDGGQTASGRPYFVMDLVKGLPITDYCDQAQLTPRERLELFVQVCQAVQHAHQKGVIHRDLKPSNVLVMVHDTTPMVKVIDFGVAKALGQELTDKTLFTGFAQMVGTPLYMSPEQAGQSGVDIDTRTDIYALGVLLYELLTGTTPFDKERLKDAGYDEIRRIIREEEPPRPSTRISTLGQAAVTVSANRQSDPKKLGQLMRRELDWVVMKALEKDRNRRYESASAFAADVQRYLHDEPVQACPPSAWYRFRKFARRNRGRLVAAAVLGLGVLVAVGGVGWAFRDRAARRARLADQVEPLLQDVERLEQGANWPQALAAAERAKAAVASSEAHDATRRQVEEVWRDLAFVARLERIRQDRATVVEAKFNTRGATQDYAQAFRDYGVDVEAMPAHEAVARLRAKPALAVPIATALDDWVAARRRLGEPMPSWISLVGLARELDPDPLRDRLRAAWGRAVTPELQAELVRIADSIDVKAESPTTLQLLARTANSAHLADAAIRILQRGQYGHPADFWLNWDLGVLLTLVRKDYAEAVLHFSIAVSLRPDNANAHNSLGAALGDQKRYQEAEAELREALRLNPDDAKAYNNLGAALGAQGKQEEAERACRNALRLQHDYPEAQNNLGHVLFYRGRHLEAEAAFREALRLKHDNPEAHTGLGAALSAQGKHEDAEAACRDALRLKPDYQEAQSNLGVALAAQGKHKEAEAAYREAIRLKPNDFEARHNLGGALTAQGKHKEAEAAYREAIRLKPDFRTYTDLGVPLAAQGKHKEAEVAYREAIRLKPDARAYTNLGALLHDYLGRYQEAEEAFRKAIRLQPDDPLPHTNLGNALKSQGKYKEAEPAYRQALRLKPDYADANNNLADLLANSPDTKQRDGRRAVAFAQLAVKAAPSNGIFWSTLGNAQYRAGSWKEAVAALKRSMELRKGGDSFDWFFLAMAHWKSGEKEKARTWFDRAVQWMDKNQPRNEELGRFRAEAAELLGMKAK
jgi:tetratricopeptide (TPR) repeat protein